MAGTTDPNVSVPSQSPGSSGAWLVFSWLWVGIPLAWGVFETVQKSLALFR